MPTEIESKVTDNGTQSAADLAKGESESVRTTEECIVQLEIADANRVCAEVNDGKHDTFDDALHYIIERGVAEIKRQRDSLAALKVQRNDAKAMSALRTAVANNPALMEDPVKLAEAFKTLGIKLSGGSASTK